MSKKVAPTKKKSSSSLLNTLALPAILLLTVIVLHPVLSKYFVSLDDPAYLKDNPYIKSLSYDSIATIFSTFYNANYHPLTTLVYAIEYHFFKLNAEPYHVINLLIHLVNVCLVYFLVLKLNSKPIIAAVVAVLFAIHPMHVESVAWISELKDVLFTGFLLAGLISYINRSLVSCFVFFLFSLLSKPAAVIFPLLLFTIDYYQKREWNRKLIFEKIPFLLLSLVFGFVTVFAQKSAGAIQADLMVPYTLFERIFVVAYGIVFYLFKLFIPVDLNAFYYAPKILSWPYYVAPFVILVIVFWIWKTKVLKREIIFGFLFYIASLILVVQIIPVGYAVVSERYSYVPYIGLFYIIGTFYERIKSLRYALPIFILILCVVSYQRSKVWKDSMTLFTDIAQKNPNTAYAQFGLGKIYDERQDFPKAIEIFSKAIKMDSTYAEYYFYRGNSYYGLKQYDNALADYLQAVRYKKEYVEAMNNVASVYNLQQRYPEAIEYFTRAIDIRPNEYLYKSRATSYYYLKKYNEAIDDYNKSIQMNSMIPDAFFNRGVSYYYLQKTSEACADWRKASSMGYSEANPLIAAYCK